MSYTVKKKEVRDENGFSGETGSAIIIALLVMVLLLGFVALAISRTTNETIASSNDTAETKTYEAAQASLEVMTRNFDKIFEVKLTPTATDLTNVKDKLPDGFTDYTFDQKLTRTKDAQIVQMTGSVFQGLNALRDEWEVETTAKDSSGVQVALRRQFYNNLIPIFQFGIFYDDNLEFHPGPRFDFGGRVHSNDNLFLMAQTGLYFSSKVTARGEVITDKARNNFDYTKWGDNVFIKNASGSFVKLKSDMGSVLTTGGGTPKFPDPDMPTLYENPNWLNNEKLFQGNLQPHQQRLDLPLFTDALRQGKIINYIELIKRGKNVGDLWNNGTSVVPVTADKADSIVTARERYANKTGIRISLADSKGKLPGCLTSGGAVTTDPCGVRLDGKKDGTNDAVPAGEARGYEPKPLENNVTFRATRINGERFYQKDATRGMWIKIETVEYDSATVAVVTKDITEDILALGVTEPLPIDIFQKIDDSRSIVKLQRYAFGTTALASADTPFFTSSGSNFVLAANYDGIRYQAFDNGTCTVLSVGHPSYNCFTYGGTAYSGQQYGDHRDHWKIPNGFGSVRIVPFPINMFDTREGLYFEGTAFNPKSGSNYGSNVPLAGVMSMVDIDVANLRQFLAGNYDTVMPLNTPFFTANSRRLTAADIPQSSGWVLYVSDRRGDADFDGEYDMEDVYGNNDGIKQRGEDINGNGSLDTDYFKEAVKYTGAGSNVPPDQAAMLEHPFYRRGVRLIRGQTLPGIYDKDNAANTRGFTVASENGVYVKGNYNATGINSVGTPTPSTDYLPQDTTLHIPASVAADAITILSNSWDDSNSFRYPFDLNSRTAAETYVRFAMLAGDTMSSKNDTPNQGGGDPRLGGGVHNFKRFLEKWSTRLNYSGSLINLYNSHNNNGSFKCCDTVYSPPTRNWVFDSSFLDAERLPPGTPYFQTLQITGFQRLD